MADIINLNQARKQRARAEKSAKAEENRVRFGRTKAQKAGDAAETARIGQLLDDSKRD
ncbi:DUF4169 family protein [Sphingomonas sp. JC676]|uniref:DUF4169 family protein n=1 Tax=Sphingomonas sp. JC676 TaxID=2768065 RepID=UPI001658042E|nr:DUF4169 family protein [Sphingomonas sp. JC676]MBC9034527.1 DUF4169 family protein [Sphingomonas sp. JC676]